MLDLGHPDAILHLFQCQECCGVYDCGHDSLLISRHQLSEELVELGEPNYQPELGSALIGEFWVDGWEEEEDGISATRLPEFYDEATLWRLKDEYPHINWFDPRQNTKFGGSPHWTANGPQGFPPSPFEFLFQLDNNLYLTGPMPAANEVGCVVSEYARSGEGTGHWVHTLPDPKAKRQNAPWGLVHENSDDWFAAEYANLASDGVIYAFIDRTQTPHQVRWFWNR